MRIGMIVAIAREMGAMFASMGKELETENAVGFSVQHYKLGEHDIYVSQSGAGELAAASTTQYLITKYGVELIVNFGVCGGLVDDMTLQRAVVVEKVVHYDFDTSAVDSVEVGRYLEYPDVYIPATSALVELALQAEPTLRAVTCASADKFIADPEKKISLAKQFNAQICEMEAAGIVMTANRNQIPVLLIKGVSDSVTGGADEFGKMVHEAASTCLNVLLRVIEKI